MEGAQAVAALKDQMEAKKESVEGTVWLRKESTNSAELDSSIGPATGTLADAYCILIFATFKLPESRRPIASPW
jgi:hypothetical protein